MKFMFPCPPTLNHLYGVMNGRRYKKPAHKQYMDTVQNILIGNRVKPFKKDVAIQMVWYRASKRGDIDNIQKTLFDGLKLQRLKIGKKTVGFSQFGMFKDDSQIADLHIIRKEDKENPRIELYCYEI